MFDTTIVIPTIPSSFFITLLGIIGFTSCIYFIYKISLFITGGYYLSNTRFFKNLRSFINRQYKLDFSKYVLGDKYSIFLETFVSNSKLVISSNLYTRFNGIILHNLKINSSFEDEVKLLVAFIILDIKWLNESCSSNTDIYNNNFNILFNELVHRSPEDAKIFVTNLYNLSTEDFYTEELQ